MANHDFRGDTAEDDPERARRGIQSIEVGGQLLIALAGAGRPLPLKDLARDAGMAPGKAHPYLVSFARIGLIEQDAASGRYFLGPLALQLGLISLQQANPVQVAAEALPGLVQAIGQTVAIAVRGTHGATIVRLEESPAAVHVNMRHGTVFSPIGTASGRLFAAHGPAEAARAALDAERVRRSSAAKPPPGMPPLPALPSWKAYEAQLAEVRTRGLSRSVGEIVPGINAMAAPVFDHAGELVLALVAIGPAGSFDVGWDGTIARALGAAARAVSARLGAAGSTAG